jgi:hypothetical protein
MKIKIKHFSLEDFREGDLFGFGRKSRCFIVEERDGELFAIDQEGYGGKLETIINTSKELSNIYNRIYLFGNINENKGKDIKEEYGF